MQAKVVIFQVTERPDYELATRAGPDRPIYVGSKGMAGAATDRAPYIPGSSRIPPAVIGPAIELGVPIYIPGYINWVPSRKLWNRSVLRSKGPDSAGPSQPPAAPSRLVPDPVGRFQKKCSRGKARAFLSFFLCGKKCG